MWTPLFEGFAPTVTGRVRKRFFCDVFWSWDFLVILQQHCTGFWYKWPHESSLCLQTTDVIEFLLILTDWSTIVQWYLLLINVFFFIWGNIRYISSATISVAIDKVKHPISAFIPYLNLLNPPNVKIRPLRLLFTCSFAPRRQTQLLIA